MEFILTFMPPKNITILINAGTQALLSFIDELSILTKLITLF